MNTAVSSCHLKTDQKVGGFLGFGGRFVPSKQNLADYVDCQTGRLKTQIDSLPIKTVGDLQEHEDRTTQKIALIDSRSGENSTEIERLSSENLLDIQKHGDMNQRLDLWIGGAQERTALATQVCTNNVPPGLASPLHVSGVVGENGKLTCTYSDSTDDTVHTSVWDYSDPAAGSNGVPQFTKYTEFTVPTKSHLERKDAAKQQLATLAQQTCEAETEVIGQLGDSLAITSHIGEDGMLTCTYNDFDNNIVGATVVYSYSAPAPGTDGVPQFTRKGSMGFQTIGMIEKLESTRSDVEQYCKAYYDDADNTTALVGNGQMICTHVLGGEIKTAHFKIYDGFQNIYSGNTPNPQLMFEYKTARAE